MRGTPSSNLKSNLIPWHKMLLFFLPVGLWFFCFRQFYSGELVLFSDSRSYFSYIKYYLENIARGVYPFWDPFEAWGRPDDLAVRWFGEFNPFFLLILLLRLIGLKFSLAFFLFMVGYFFLGMAGFYLLSLRLYQDRRAAYAAMLLLTFSSLAGTFFNDMAILLLLVPCVWFFYFLIAFFQGPERRWFLGATFALMIINVTYIPFYFLTILSIAAVMALALDGREIFCWLKEAWRFITRRWGFALFCLGLLLLSIVPGWHWYQAGGSGDYWVGWRHIGSAHGNVASLSLEVASQGGIIGPFYLRSLIIDVMDLEAGLCYVPVFGFLVLLIGAIAPARKKLIGLTGCGLFLLFIGMTQATSLHAFLFRHIFYFRFIRNLQYFLWLALPFFVLAAAGMLRDILSITLKDRRERIIFFVYSTILHAGFFVFLILQEDVVLSTIVNVIVSWIFFAFLSLGKDLHQREQWILWGLLICAVIQPMEVLYHLGWKYRGSSGVICPEESFRPGFAYVRPEGKIDTQDYDFFYRQTADTSGFQEKVAAGFKYFGLRKSFLLQEKIPKDVLNQYVKYKFVVYDRVVSAPEDGDELELLTRSIEKDLNLAVAAGADKEVADPLSERTVPNRQVITGPGPEFQVKHFDLNALTIQTHFPRRKFMVYNDSYHRDWRARLNGRPVPVWRANVAFKGIWLPAGENTLVLTFRSGPRRMLYQMMVAVFPAVLAYLIYLFIFERKKDATGG